MPSVIPMLRPDSPAPDRGLATSNRSGAGRLSEQELCRAMCSPRRAILTCMLSRNLRVLDSAICGVFAPLALSQRLALSRTDSQIVRHTRTFRAACSPFLRSGGCRFPLDLLAMSIQTTYVKRSIAYISVDGWSRIVEAETLVDGPSPHLRFLKSTSSVSALASACRQFQTLAFAAGQRRVTSQAIESSRKFERGVAVRV